MITIELAGIAIGVDNKYPHMERLSSEYITDRAPDFIVSASDSAIDEEERISGIKAPKGYFETVVLYREIARRLPDYDAFVFHSAVLNLFGRAYAFAARSGVGKTTHTRLWIEAFGDEVHYLNGDKPIIRFKDGVPYACGTPYKGKEGYGVREDVPLSGIAFLERSESNSAELIEPEDAVTCLVTQIYLPCDEPLAVAKTMMLADRLLSSLRIVKLKCNMDISAAYVARRVLAGAEDKYEN